MPPSKLLFVAVLGLASAALLVMPAPASGPQSVLRAGGVRPRSRRSLCS